MTSLRTPINDFDHTLGSSRAELSLVEYGDYECPFCAAAQEVVRAVRSQYGTRLRFVFRHFPLATMHPHATQAAEIAEAAGAQDAFWDMHELLFANQRSLEQENLLRLAASLDLDLDRVVDDLETGRFLPRVHDDFLGGARSGVNSTPTFFINGQRHEAGWDLPALSAALDRARNRLDQVEHGSHR